MGIAADPRLFENTWSGTKTRNPLPSARTFGKSAGTPSVQALPGNSPGITVRLLLFSLVLLPSLACSGRIASGVSREQLLRVRPGMTSSAVAALLGPPLAKSRPGKRPAWDPSCVEEESWIYAEPGLLGGGFEIGARFCERKLSRVAAERHDLGFFWCKPGECPVIWNEKDWELLPP